jgi:hypothetical protein
MMMKSELEQIPGIGENMAQRLINVGYPTIASLRGQNPDEIYLKDCIYHNAQIDRCALYQYRLAVAYANGTITDSEKLKWWDWQDGEETCG